MRIAIMELVRLSYHVEEAAEELGAWSQTVKTLGAGWTDTFIYFILLPIRSG